MQEARSCNGEIVLAFGPDSALEEFDCCPIKWQQKHALEAALFNLYLDCCGGAIGDGMKFLPFSGGASEQPESLMRALGVINGAINNLIQDELKK